MHACASAEAHGPVPSAAVLGLQVDDRVHVKADDPSSLAYASGEHILSCSTVKEIECTMTIFYTMANAIVGA